MAYEDKEKHIDIYENRSELYQNGESIVFYEGFQNQETQRRYIKINQVLADGFLEKKFNSIANVDFSMLSEDNQRLLRNLVNGITSEVGRALVGLAFLQLAIKSITPEQSIRLHKGATRRGSFSWVEGISMRTIDSRYNTPFLRSHGLLKLNSYGCFMTRSLAENYPYTSLYKAEMRGSFEDWIAIVDAIENDTMPPELGLCYMMALLRNRSEDFQQQAEQACILVNNYKGKTFNHIKSVITTFFNTTDYSARAFEVVIHSLLQAMDELQLLGGLNVVPLSQMRSANKKHGNVGDIELVDNNIIVEAWDAKYGKPYLRDEIEELRDKLLSHADVKIAGFIVDSDVDFRKDIINRQNEVEIETATKIYLFSFDEWLKHELAELNSQQKDELAYKWLQAIVESFAQKRLEIAPIDEPCDEWIKDLIKIMHKVLE